MDNLPQPRINNDCLSFLMFLVQVDMGARIPINMRGILNSYFAGETTKAGLVVLEGLVTSGLTAEIQLAVSGHMPAACFPALRSPVKLS